MSTCSSARRCLAAKRWVASPWRGPRGVRKAAGASPPLRPASPIGLRSRASPEGRSSTKAWRLRASAPESTPQRNGTSSSACSSPRAVRCRTPPIAATKPTLPIGLTPGRPGRSRPSSPSSCSRAFRAGVEPITLFPCELTPANGKVLRGVVLDVLDRWQAPANARRWVEEECVWVNSLVDRIVSEPLEPLGAVAEPYALWAIEDQPGLELPCRHAAIVVAGDLKPYERLKLFILNLGHTYLAEIWARDSGAPGLTVREAMADTATRAKLDALYDEEVLPVFAAIGMGDEARTYLEHRHRAILQSLSRSPPVRNLHQPRGQEAAAVRRPHRPRQGERCASPPAAPEGRARRRPLDGARCARLGRPHRRAAFRLRQSRGGRGRLERRGGAIRADARARAALGGGLVRAWGYSGRSSATSTPPPTPFA